MKPLSGREQRVAKVAELREAAARLETLTGDPDLRERLVIVSSDLDEAATLLASPALERRPSLLLVVDVVLTVALSRLRVVDELVARSRPDVLPFPGSAPPTNTRRSSPGQPQRSSRTRPNDLTDD
jgi:hypothetical protein